MYSRYRVLNNDLGWGHFVGRGGGLSRRAKMGDMKQKGHAGKGSGRIRRRTLTRRRRTRERRGENKEEQRVERIQ